MSRTANIWRELLCAIGVVSTLVCRAHRPRSRWTRPRKQSAGMRIHFLALLLSLLAMAYSSYGMSRATDADLDRFHAGGNEQCCGDSGENCDQPPYASRPECKSTYITVGGQRVARGCSDDTPNGTECVKVVTRSSTNAECRGCQGSSSYCELVATWCKQVATENFNLTPPPPLSKCGVDPDAGYNQPCECLGAAYVYDVGTRQVCVAGSTPCP
jgi:hypothetical protein